MKTYLELEGKLGTQPQLQSCTSTYSPDKSPMPWKTPVPKKAEKKKRTKALVKRGFKVRVIVQPLPVNPALSADPAPTVVTTTVTSTQTSVTKPATATAKSNLIPVTVYSLGQGTFKEISHPARKSQEEEGPSTPSSNNHPKVQQPEATTTATALHTSEDTPWPNTMPTSTNLFVERASWPIHPIMMKYQHPPFSKLKRQKTGPHPSNQLSPT